MTVEQRYTRIYGAAVNIRHLNNPALGYFTERRLLYTFLRIPITYNIHLIIQVENNILMIYADCVKR